MRWKNVCDRKAYLFLWWRVVVRVLFCCLSVEREQRNHSSWEGAVERWWENR